MATGKKQKVVETQTPFDRAYKNLNTAQKQAVDTIEGPVMVIAGPGTGKTQILALRIANILKRTDTAPSSILALTFTESGVASMRARLVALMGQDGYRVRIHTFHGFCNEVIRLYPDRFPAIIGRTPLIELDALGIVKGLLDEIRPKLLRPDGRPDFYVRDILGKLSEVKREHITPTVLSERIVAERLSIESAVDLYHEKGAHKGKMKGAYTEALRSLARAEEFVALYSAYEQALITTAQYDFEDTIIAVIETLATDEDLKLIVQEEYQYILADEHQDANGSQNELLVLLSDFHSEPNLFVVGDEKQAIYRFQGASLENFFSFTDRYPHAVCISLSDNYRSTQRILDAAHMLIEPAQGHAVSPRVRLQSRADHDEQEIACIHAPDEDTEHTYIAEHIQTVLAGGTHAHEVAILVRRNSDVPVLASVLQRREIPYVAHGDDPILTHPVVCGFLTFLRGVANFGDNALLFPVLTLPYSGISNIDMYRLMETSHRKTGSLYMLLHDESALATLGVRDVDACNTLATIIDTCINEVREYPISIMIERFFSRSGCLAYIIGRDDGLSVLDIIRAFFRYVRILCDSHSVFSLPDILHALEEAQEYRLAIGGILHSPLNAVRIMTVHRAKGMEFDHVFIPHVHDRLWGVRRNSNRLPLPLFAGARSTTSEDDERRLLYVAMTRARKMLTLSYATVSDTGTMQVLSRFIEPLIGSHLTEQTTPSLAKPLFVQIRERVPQPILSDEEKHFLQKRFLDQGLSVTGLNNYLQSPWKYFFHTLLHIPRPRNVNLLYGSTMDETLKWYTERRKELTTPTSEEVLRIFTTVLARQPLTKKDFETYRARGVTALTGYLATYAGTWITETESAVKISVPFDVGLPELPIITLRGELDKIEYLSTDTIRIVDYKTGKSKTRGEIEGTTKTSLGNLKRQLVFYQLLISGDTMRHVQVQEGLLDFVEPDTRGTYRRESFEITHTDTEALKTAIREVAHAIHGFTFWDTPCDPQAWDAEGCALVEALKNRS